MSRAQKKFNAFDLVKPLSGFLLVQKDELPSHFKEIVLPEANSLRPCSGIVKRPSDSVADWLPVGTRVLFGPNSGELMRVGERDAAEVVLMLHETEVQATIPAGVEVEIA